MTLRNIKPLGGYRNIEANKEYNIFKGTDLKRGTDHIFYLYKNRKQFITDRDFYSLNYTKLNP